MPRVVFCEDAAKAKNLTKEDEERYSKLFQKLDTNKDGRIEVSELAVALQKQSVSKQAATGHAKHIITRGDKDADAELDFAEFTKYMQEHERQLKLAFSDLDRNKDGQIEPAEVQSALTKLGVHVDLAEATELTKRIDRDGDLKIDWAEWRDFFGLCSGETLEDMVSFWQHNLMIDIGENLTVPPEFTKKEQQTGMWWRHLVAGGMAGAVSRTLTAPLDRVKIMLQVHGSKHSMGVADSLKLMLKEGGVKSLWRGNGTNVLKIAPESAIKFAAYEQIKKLIVGDRKKSITVIERFAAGAMAGAVAQTTIYPLEVIKTRLAVSKTGEYKGILDCGVKIFKKGGPTALFKGYIPNLVGIIPYAGIDLTIYETLKQYYLRNTNTQDPSILLLLACGTVSSTCGQLASYPFALVRTKLQAGVTPDGTKPAMLPLAKAILKKEGPRGLYRGIAPNFLKVLPAVSISYVIYERAKTMLGVSK